MKNPDAYYCVDCGQHFGDIPALGCPYCNSDNYYPTDIVEVVESELINA